MYAFVGNWVSAGTDMENRAGGNSDQPSFLSNPQVLKLNTIRTYLYIEIIIFYPKTCHYMFLVPLQACLTTWYRRNLSLILCSIVRPILASLISNFLKKGLRIELTASLKHPSQFSQSETILRGWWPTNPEIEQLVWLKAKVKLLLTVYSFLADSTPSFSHWWAENNRGYTFLSHCIFFCIMVVISMLCRVFIMVCVSCNWLIFCLVWLWGLHGRTSDDDWCTTNWLTVAHF